MRSQIILSNYMFTPQNRQEDGIQLTRINFNFPFQEGEILSFGWTCTTATGRAITRPGQSDGAPAMVSEGPRVSEGGFMKKN